MIEIENVRYKVSESLDSDAIALTVPSGERMFIVGPPDSGKTKLLRICAGLEKPLTGSVLIEGRKYSSEVAKSFYRRLGYVSQSSPLFDHLTAYENLALAPRAYGWPKAKIEGRISELSTLFGLSQETWERPPYDLSISQRQRYAVARSLMLEPFTLLLDEPLQGLDRLNSVNLIKGLIEATKDFPPAMIIVCGDLEMAMKFGDRLCLMRDGHILIEGTPSMIANSSNKLVQEMLSRLEVKA